MIERESVEILERKKQIYLESNPTPFAFSRSN